ncbi:hypothetical protein CEE37_12415 [candidate division LCP-89 bacterium B3_LCP]|uniref:Helicase ATP-binding domain-containing protein n=1 Tax=candidate division LCP-89 bacterium B3_LCP TaxID=2012998 RepID=A0A532UUE1_UNCL8|nr:MAG: hypothetical protein CEE37_12415 [candidate division LCP-89 bacterium B3_LCP]
MCGDSNAASSGFSFTLRGKLGSEAHRKLQDQRNKTGGYRQEVHLNVPLVLADNGSEEWSVRVRGRLDGLIEEIDRTVVEEIKTVALSPSNFQSFSPLEYPRHKQQIEIYLHLLAIARPDANCVGNLIYVNLPDNRRRSFEIPYISEEIESQIAELIEDLVLRLNRREDEKEQKRQTAVDLKFPFPKLRPGQERIISELEDTLQTANDILIEAPTGLGKTVAVLYAALKYALSNDRRLLFLTSKTTQQDLVFNTTNLIRSDAPFPRTLWMRARHKMCLQEEQLCHPNECEHLVDFQRRVRRSKILEELLLKSAIHPDDLEAIGKEHTLCPHEMSLLLCQDMDLLIGDYNYAFDPSCRPSVLFGEGDPSEMIFITDEAHNLPERARGYYSAVLHWSKIEAAHEKLRGEGISRFDEVLAAIKSQFAYYLNEAPQQHDPYPIQFSDQHWLDIMREFEEAVVPYWYRIMSSDGSGEEDPVFNLQRDLEAFHRSLGYEGDNFVGLIRRRPEVVLENLCLDASPFLGENFAEAHASVCMSATLEPFDVSKQLLGLNEKAVALPLENPFPQENRHIAIDTTVTTLYRTREENIIPIAQRIEKFHQMVNRRTLAFFPSFELMNRVAEHISKADLLKQEAEMSDRQRSDLLKRFKQSDRGLLLCVMGGVFAEGVDLPGDQVEAAVVVGVGLPQVCTENELLRAYFDRLGCNGFGIAYLYPGMRRVIQSVGRIIRSEDDRGMILLLDSRYEREEYMKLIPRHWYNSSSSELFKENWEDSVNEFLLSYKD